MKDGHCTVVRFDYGGYYSKNGNDVRWNRKEDRVYTLVMKGLLEEFTYSGLVNRICKKIMLDEATSMLRLSYIPLLEDPKRQTYILDDEDVLGYLMEGDQNQRRDVLHVELVEGVEQNQSCGEQVSREDGRSGIDVRNDEIPSGSRVNDGNVGFEPLGQYAPLDPCDDVAYVDNSGMFVDVDSTPDVRGDEVGSLEWEDGIGLSIGQEFESKQAVQDVVDRGIIRNCFEVATFKSSTRLYVLKCRDSSCKWSLRVSMLKNLDRFSVRTYNKMHTCSRLTTGTRRDKRIGTPQLVASVLRENYQGELNSLKPKNLISLVEERLGVKVSYSTALRGKKQAANDVQGSLHTQ
ncbi:PREDICTED: uncharacterized protein LOC104773592 [Camelina sativa]|uniref:Uncharacterized protein LOC104773592 n=1 Tax=Camelina sativa TaxID=90675 RepID=A0ABM0Y716_CAMSA|nr:PREDICTED: uncharacterized protein LOC104773592 [Camelina sativa]XP_010496539.1 PREDICTED: uncharacterized protein LOC104773592 [Camelina sativa]